MARAPVAHDYDSSIEFFCRPPKANKSCARLVDLPAVRSVVIRRFKRVRNLCCGDRRVDQQATSNRGTSDQTTGNCRRRNFAAFDRRVGDLGVSNRRIGDLGIVYNQSAPSFVNECLVIVY